MTTARSHTKMRHTAGGRRQLGQRVTHRGQSSIGHNRVVRVLRELAHEATRGRPEPDPIPHTEPGVADLEVQVHAHLLRALHEIEPPHDLPPWTVRVRVLDGVAHTCAAPPGVGKGLATQECFGCGKVVLYSGNGCCGRCRRTVRQLCPTDDGLAILGRTDAVPLPDPLALAS